MLTKDKYTVTSLAKWGWGSYQVSFKDNCVFIKFFPPFSKTYIIVYGLIISTCARIPLFFWRRIDFNTSKLFDRRSLFANVLPYR